MGSDRWTLDDGRRWAALDAAWWPTVVLVVLWLAVRVIAARQNPVGSYWFDDNVPVAVPLDGFGLWVVACLGSVVLIRVWPEAALGCAVAFAVADVWWVAAAEGWQLLRAVAVGGYAVACAAHTWYLRRAVVRQRRFALEHAKPDVRVPPLLPATLQRMESAIDLAEWVGILAVSFGTVGIAAGFAAGYGMSLYETSPDDSVSPVTWIPAVAAATILTSGVLWRSQHGALTALRRLSTGGYPGLPVDLTVGAHKVRAGQERVGKVRVCARGHDEPFTTFTAFIPPTDNQVPDTAQPATSAVPVETTVPGYLYGDLHTKGRAALATADTVLLPVSTLKRTSVDGHAQPDPVPVQDSPAPDAVVVAQAVGWFEAVRKNTGETVGIAITWGLLVGLISLSVADVKQVVAIAAAVTGVVFVVMILVWTERTRVEVRPHEIVTEESLWWRRKPTRVTIGFDEITSVGLVYQNGRQSLKVQAPGRTLSGIREGPGRAAALAIGQRLVAHGRVDTVENDDTRTRLGLAGEHRAAPPHQPPRPRTPIDHTAPASSRETPQDRPQDQPQDQARGGPQDRPQDRPQDQPQDRQAPVLAAGATPEATGSAEVAAQAGRIDGRVDQATKGTPESATPEPAAHSRRYADNEHGPPSDPIKVRGRLRVVWLAVWLAAAAMYGAIAFFAEGQSAAWSDRLFRACFLVLAAVHVVGGVRGFGRGLDADGYGVVVRNRLVPGVGDSIPLRLRRPISIPWRDLAAIEFGVTHEDVYRLVFLRRDGSRVAAQVPGGGIEPGQYLFELRERLFAMRDAARAGPHAPTDEPTDAARTDQDVAVPAGATRRRIVYRGTIAAIVGAAAVIGIITDTGADDVTADPEPPAVNLPSQSPVSTPSLSSTTPEPSPVPGRQIYWENLQPGMCGSLDISDHQQFTLAACSAEHEVEVMSRSTLAGSKEYPGFDIVDAAALAKCERAFAAYVGLQWEDSLLDLDYLVPHEWDWKAGKVMLICLVWDWDNPYDLTRSLRGAHR
jgi:hypothetical protein